MIYDVAIIGAGITGAMIARELSQLNTSVCVIEAAADIASGATRANSGIVHAGYDALPGSMKARMNVRGNALMGAAVKELGVPYDNCGSLVVAFDDEEDKSVDMLLGRGRENGVPVEKISGDEVRQKEPALSEELRSALWAPTGGIVSPFELAIAAMENAAANGAEVYLNSQVSAISKENSVFVIHTGENVIKARFVVNAAGVYADDISKMAGAEVFTINARRGEYVLFDKSQPVRVKSVIFGAPSEKGKGVLFSPTAHGNMIAGPTAEFTGKEDTATTSEGLKAVMDGVCRYVPSINKRSAITVFAGLRAVGDRHDFIIEESKSMPGFVNVAGIESPGLTSAPAIAEYVTEMLVSMGIDGTKNADATRIRKPIEVFAHATPERQCELIKADQRYANVICRCEHVTEAEIVQSINRPCGATTVDGVKLRTSAGFGRCHGGFCMPRVMDILARELGRDLKDITKSGEGSWILGKRTKEAAK
jgi:glycerol-3-phosphate dehydrogenase